jgi:hypothetical protein
VLIPGNFLSEYRVTVFKAAFYPTDGEENYVRSVPIISPPLKGITPYLLMVRGVPGRVNSEKRPFSILNTLWKLGR